MSFRIDSTSKPPGTSEGSRTIVAMTCMCVDGVSSARKAASIPVSRCIRTPIGGPCARSVRGRVVVLKGPAARQNEWMGWAYLAVSLVGAWFTFNAYRPTRRWQLLTLSFFAGWFTSELAVFHIAWQVAATGLFVWLGALGSWAGIVGLLITLASWAGLLGLQLVSGRSAQVVEDALRDGLGPNYRSEIAPGLAERLVRRSSRRHLLLPFYLRDRRVERVKNLQY